MHHWTQHAQERARERFDGIDLASALHAARPAGRKTKQRIRDDCPRSARRWMHGYRGRYYLVSPERIVFVIAVEHDTHKIVTVFRLRS